MTTTETPQPAATATPGSSNLYPDHIREAAKDVLSSIVGSALCVYTGQPFDTIKVRMQAKPEAFTGPIQCLRLSLKEEGVRALWKGSVPALVCHYILAPVGDDEYIGDDKDMRWLQ